MLETAIRYVKIGHGAPGTYGLVLDTDRHDAVALQVRVGPPPPGDGLHAALTPEGPMIDPQASAHGLLEGAEPLGVRSGMPNWDNWCDLAPDTVVLTVEPGLPGVPADAGLLLDEGLDAWPGAVLRARSGMPSTGEGGILDYRMGGSPEAPHLLVLSTQIDMGEAFAAGAMAWAW